MRALIMALTLLMTIPIGAGGAAVTSAVAASSTPKQPQASPSAYSGIAEISYVDLPRFDLPSPAASYAGHLLATVHFAVRDSSHFRVDIQVVSPAIESGTITVAANGTVVTTYDSRSGLAFRSPVPSRRRTAALQDLLGTLLSGAQDAGALVPMPNPNKPVSAYLSRLLHVNPASGVRFHARIIGQDTLLGRAADIIGYGPTVVQVIANACHSNGKTSSCHPRKFHGSGTARIWIDHNHPFVLRYRGQGPVHVHSIDAGSNSTLFQVTSIAYGQGPTDADLSFQPPVKVVPDSSIYSFAPAGGDSGPGPGVSPPGPFAYPGPPNDGGLTWSEGTQRLGYGPRYKIASVTVLFSTGQYRTAYFYKPRKLGPMPYVVGPYLFVQEQLQVAGLPASLKTGIQGQVGGCEVWSGTYSDGQHWLALARRRAAILLSTNALTSTQLLAYAGSNVCP